MCRCLDIINDREDVLFVVHACFASGCLLTCRSTMAGGPPTQPYMEEISRLSFFFDDFKSSDEVSV